MVGVRLITGRKRHALVDADTLPLRLLVHPADVQDSDGALAGLKASRARHPFVTNVFAERAYNSERRERQGESGVLRSSGPMLFALFGPESR